jgi:S-DNA-T family DNA segregation ATPase FtsK/SpoIIIE
VTNDPLRVAAPSVPAPPHPYSFPVMATVAPVVVSLAIWFITGSAFALIFAALGPAVAIASLADARIQSRRRRRRERARFRAEAEAARADIAAAHGRERAELAETLPSARRLVTGRWPQTERWLGGLDAPLPVGVGFGSRPSRVALEGAATTRSRDPSHDELRLLAELAGTLHDAPIVVDARLGVGVAGPRTVANAAARAVLLQVLASLPPATHPVDVETDEPDEWRWLELVPHPVTISRVEPPSTVVRVRGAVGRDPGIVVAVAGHTALLPTAARVVVAVRGLRSRLEQHPERGLTGPLTPHFVSREEAVAVADELAALARRSGSSAAAVPDHVAFGDCGSRDPGPPHPTTEIAPGSLEAVVAATARHPLRLDLVRQGPHAVVGGTTGSGKSELLTAWILAIANDHPPGAASVLLVDFKGGSAFSALQSLPHCVGMITDLDETGARRALESLAAELRRRERHLADAGAKSIDALAPGASLPRLIIVVDEFAAMVSGFPELHAMFGDIAARGRSLGVHLILCTQRPAGVIRDSVLANSGLRLSLRVNNRADSLAVIGTDDAASLPLEPRGRAFVTDDDGEPSLAQFPLVTQRDIDRVAARWSSDHARPHRPWLDPLPATVPLDEVRSRPHDGIPFGLLDDPANQAQPAAVYRPADHGNLLVVGAAGAGKSALLSTLSASATAHLVPADIEGAWDALVDFAAQLRGPAAASEPKPAPPPDPPARLVLLDDVDALLARFPEEYEGAVVELLTRCLREGPARGIHWAITAQRVTPALHTAASLCGSRLLLRLPNRQEHVLAGGDGSEFVDGLPPGAGQWQGLRLQVAEPPRRPQPHHGRHVGAPRIAVLDARAPLAVVSARPADFAARLRAALPEFAAPHAVVHIGADSAGPSASGVLAVSGAVGPRAIVGDVEAWQAQWGALAAARPNHAVVVDGCTASEFRAVTRVRALPPVLDGARLDHFWLLTADGRVNRAALPHQ